MKRFILILYVLFFAFVFSCNLYAKRSGGRSGSRSFSSRRGAYKSSSVRKSSSKTYYGTKTYNSSKKYGYGGSNYSKSDNYYSYESENDLYFWVFLILIIFFYVVLYFENKTNFIYDLFSRAEGNDSLKRRIKYAVIFSFLFLIILLAFKSNKIKKYFNISAPYLKCKVLSINQSCNELGDLYVRYNYSIEKITEAYSKACDFRIEKGCLKLAEVYKRYGDYETSFYFYKKTCELNKYYCYTMGLIYEQGRLNKEKNEDKAIEYYEKACEFKNSEACEKLEDGF